MTLGLESDTTAEILSGLKENEQVLVGEQSQYKPGEAGSSTARERAIGGGVSHVELFSEASVFHRGHLPFRLRAGRYSSGEYARRHVPADQYSGRGSCHVLQRHASAADRGGYHGYVRALLHVRQRHRASRVAFDVRRQSDQNLLPAGDGRERGRDANFEPGHGGPAGACRKEHCRPW